MDISQRGIELIVSFEGKHKRLPNGKYAAYLDTLAKPAVPTIYCGLTKGVTMGMVCTEEEGERMFRKELAVYEDAVERLVTVPLNQNQFDALVCWVYNCGVGALQKSTLLKLLNQGKYETVPAQLMRWVNAGGKRYEGLARRRAAEGALFMEPMPLQAPDVAEGPEAPAMPQRVEEATPTTAAVIKNSTTAQVSIWGTIAAAVVSFIQWLFGFAQTVSTEVMANQQSVSGFSALWSFIGVNASTVVIGILLLTIAGVLMRSVQRGKTA